MHSCRESQPLDSFPVIEATSTHHATTANLGNFYANIALRTTDIDTVARTLTTLDRRAYVARDRGATFVYDDKCDEQDLDALEHLTAALSTELRCVALAACNHDDDVLVILLAEGGTLSDRYDSNPGYFDGPPAPPHGGDAERLCTAFGVPAQVGDVEQVFRAPREAIAAEVDRHAALCRLLGLSERMASLGYTYVGRGELVEDIEPATLRLISPARIPTSPEILADPEGADNSVILAMQAEGKDLFWNMYALALGGAEVSERFVPLFGVQGGTGHLLLSRLQQHVVSHRLVKGGLVDADDLLAEFLGERQFTHAAIPRLLRSALHIPPLSEDQIAAIERGDPALLRAIADAMSVDNEEA
jgi:hypothetical protein